MARLLSELITGGADPKGPHRPSKAKEGDKDKEEAVGAGSSGGAKASEGQAAGKVEEEEKEGGKEGSGEEKKGEGEGEEGEGRSRTFAERYVGPEGTTVTISAAPAPPFGIPGLPPMEGPSLSIKNPGDGAEPEVRVHITLGSTFHLYI